MFSNISILDYYIQLALERKMVTPRNEERWSEALTYVREQVRRCLVSWTGHAETRRHL